MYTVEEFDPDPFLDALDRYGLPRSESHDPEAGRLMEGLEKEHHLIATGGIIPPEFREYKNTLLYPGRKALIKNAKLLGEVAERTGCKMLLAQKAFSNYDCYPFLNRILQEQSQWTV